MEEVRPAEDKKWRLAGPEPKYKSQLLKCPGCPYRGPQCGSRGRLDSPIVFVGEAPGHEEVRHKFPLVGPSGTVFWGTLPPKEAMEEYGIPLEDILILNACQCQPPRSKNQQENMRRVSAARLVCQDRLIWQIEQHPRKLIVAMGNHAVWALTGNISYKITQIRGNFIPSELAEMGILPVVHPAGILRGTGNYRQYKMDMWYSVDLMRGQPKKKPLEPYFLVCDTEEKVREAVRRLMKKPVLDMDIETTGFNPRVDDVLCIGIAYDPRLVYIFPGGIRSVDRMIELEADESWMDGGYNVVKHSPAFREFMQKYPGKMCWHMGKFDIGFMREEGHPDARVDEDTGMMSYALDEQRGIHDLEQVSGDLFGAPDYKYMIKRWVPKFGMSYCRIPRYALYNYLAFDVSNTGQIRLLLLVRITEDPRLKKLYYRHLIPACDTLSWIERRGMPASRWALERQQKRLQEEIDRTRLIVNVEANRLLKEEVYINPGSPQQMGWLFWDVMGFEVPKGMEKSTRKEVVAKLPQTPLVVAYREFKKAQKAKGTYADALLRAIDPVTGRIHPTFLIHGTRTGRLAHKDIANIPRDKKIRGMFAFELGMQHLLPKPYINTGSYGSGRRKYVKADLDQAELRVLAAMSGDPELCAIYLDGKRKLHREVSDMIWGSPGNSEGKASGIYKWGNEEYMRAKALNFGIIYGRRGPSIAQEFSIPEAEGTKYVDMWRDKFRTAWDFIEYCRGAPLRMETIITPFGRKKRHWIVTQENLNGLENEAANFPEQSIASDIVLEASKQLGPKLRAMDCWIVFLIHDEILTDVPDDIGLIREARQMIEEELERAPKTWGITRVPFKADTSVGKRWGIYTSSDRPSRETGLTWEQYLETRTYVADVPFEDTGDANAPFTVPIVGLGAAD